MKARQRSNWATLTGGWSQASRVLVVGVLEVIIVGAELCTVLVPLKIGFWYGGVTDMVAVGELLAVA